MATNKTANYGLNQWVKSDEVVMEDFNEDNRKIEAAIAAAAVSPCCVTGTYQGNGGTLEVNLGFRPSFLMIKCSHVGSVSSNNYVFVMGTSKNMIYGNSNGVGSYGACTFTDTGFTITDTSQYSINYTNVTATYAAFY